MVSSARFFGSTETAQTRGKRRTNSTPCLQMPRASPVAAAPASTSPPQPTSRRKGRRVEVSRSRAAAEETRCPASADPPRGLAAAGQGAAAVRGETAAPAAGRSCGRDSRGLRPPQGSHLARWSNGGITASDTGARGGLLGLPLLGHLVVGLLGCWWLFLLDGRIGFFACSVRLGTQTEAEADIPSS